MKNITTLVVGERKFEIVLKDGYYLSIEDKYIDSEGRLLETRNGLQMNASETLEECIKRTKQKVEVDMLVAEGMNPMEAVIQVVCNK